jgi:hypothetical protein
MKINEQNLPITIDGEKELLNILSLDILKKIDS